MSAKQQAGTEQRVIDALWRRQWYCPVCKQQAPVEPVPAPPTCGCGRPYIHKALMPTPTPSEAV